MMDVKIQKYEMKSDAASKDLQTVHSVVALNFHIDGLRKSEADAFGELDFPIGRSDSQQVSSVSSTPGPSNGNPDSIVDQLIDVALEVGWDRTSSIISIARGSTYRAFSRAPASTG